MACAYDVLRRACGFDAEIPPNNCDMILSALFLNWDRAQDIRTKNELSHDELWELFFRVGFVSGRVALFADAGIRSIVKRIIDLKWLTDECCSGHAGDVRTDPYIGIVFPHVSVRAAFSALCKKRFSAMPFSMLIADDMEESEPSKKYRERHARSTHPFAWFHEQRISTSFRWMTSSDEENQLVWNMFSAVLDTYDNKGLYEPRVESLRLYDNAEEGTRLLEKVYTKLCLS